MKNLIHVGSFEIKNQHGGMLIVTDPMYKLGTWCSCVLNMCAGGTWNAFVLRGEERRVAMLIAFHDSIDAEKHHSKWFSMLKNVEIGVDSGSLFIGDLSYFAVKNEKLADPSIVETYTDLAPYAGIVENCGVMSRTGWGDGGYPIFIYERKGKFYRKWVYAVRIDFMEEAYENV